MMIEQNTLNWQISLNNPADTVRDIDDIAQCIQIILTTVKGSDPLRPTFGSDVFKYIDRPMNTVDPMLVYEVYDSIERWEKRITVSRVKVVTVDLDKKAIAIYGFVSGSSDEITILFNPWEKEEIRRLAVLQDGDGILLGDKFNNIFILVKNG